METWQHPFSNAQAAAAWLKSNHLDAAPWVGTPDNTAADVAEVLRRPVYMLDCNCTDTFILYARWRDAFSIPQILDRLVTARRNLNVSEFVYLGAVPLTLEQEEQIRARGFDMKPLAQFSGAEEPEENVYIYDLASALGS